MFKQWAQKITKFLISNKIIPEESFELYRSGFELTIASVVNIITTLVIGAAFGMPLEALLFLAAFIPLRSYVGGFHASNHFLCYWLSVFAVIAVLFAARLVLSVSNAGIILAAVILLAAIVLLLVPVQDANRPLEDIEVRVFRRRARIIICIEVLIIAISLILKLKTVFSVLSCTMLVTCATAFAGSVKNLLSQRNRM